MGGYLDTGEVSARLKSLRHQRQFSLRGLAARAGVAASFIAKVESGRASPTIMTLQKILEAMNVTVAEFFNDGSTGPADGVVFRRESMKALEDADRRWLYAFPSVRDIGVILTYEEFQPRTKVRETERHEGDICGYVVKGELTLNLPGRGTYQVRRGDAFFIKAGVPHVAGNEKKTPLAMVVVQVKQGRGF